MTVSDFQVENYRSLKFVNFRLKRVNVVVGKNGSGKSNLYKALKLLYCAAEGRLARTIAEEGGMSSALWAGPKGKGPVRMKLAVKIENGLKYELELGLPVPFEHMTPFLYDPLVKEERVSLLKDGNKTILLDRKAQAVHARGIDGKRVTFPHDTTDSESVISELREPHRFPELSALRSEFLNWRFYHKFRTDEDSPLRKDQVATRTMCLSHDGSDLVSAIKTINWVGDENLLTQSIDNAFPGAQLVLDLEDERRLNLGLQMPGFNRPFDVRELSDGTLHYLCLLAALLSPRPAGLIALNEPEASVHPDLLSPLADLVARASKFSQIWVITHSFDLAKLISERCNVDPIELEKKDDGASKIRANDYNA